MKKKPALRTRFQAYQKPETGLRLFPGKVDFMRWFPVAFPTNGILNMTRARFELATRGLSSRKKVGWAREWSG